MTVCFIESPAEKQVGGLDAAIASLRAALTRAGVNVVDEEALTRGTERIDIAHFHGLWQPRHCALAPECRARGIPCVVSPHGMLEPWAWRHKRWKKLPYFLLRERARLASAAGLLATAENEARRLREFFPKANVRALPLGLTGGAKPDHTRARQLLDWRADERVLLFLSRVHPKKGLDLLLRALLGNRNGRARLVVVGGGEERYVRELQSFAKEHAGELPRVDWIGEVWGDARWKYFQAADLFCLPSHSENFGLAVLEACQVGTPALTTTATPWADALGAEENRRGIICEPRVESIRGALERFFSHPVASPSERAALADWAWRTFHWDALAPRYAEFYESIARESAAPRDDG